MNRPEPVVIHCRPEDMKHIKIRCRCGESSVADIPRQITKATSLHVCPKCGAGFTIQQQDDQTWKFTRLPGTVRDAAIADITHLVTPTDDKPVN